MWKSSFGQFELADPVVGLDTNIVSVLSIVRKSVVALTR